MTVKHRHSNKNDHDLYEDVEKIKAALIGTVSDVKGKAGAMLSNSVDGVREQSDKIKENVANYTAEKPVQSLGMALLVGVAIGYLLKK